MKKYIALSILLAFSPTVFASTGVTLDAGQLVGPSSSITMQVDNTSPSSNGSLLLLIDLGSSGTVDNTLTAGNYVSGQNSILAAGGFNNNSSGINETITNFVITGTTGDTIALRWFPQITFAQFESGSITPAAGDYFGTYTPMSGMTPNTPDGGDPWIVPNPTAGSPISLNFFTTNDEGGSQSPSEGVASFTVGASVVPEPATSAMLGMGVLALVVWLRRSSST